MRLEEVLFTGWPRAFAVRLAETYMRIVFATVRWNIVGEDNIRPYRSDARPLIVAYWHGRMLMTWNAWRSTRPCWVLTSKSRHGAFIADVVSRFGYSLVRGSRERPGERRGKGGAAALWRCSQILADGGVVVITPDGPSGPRMRAQLGVATLLRMSQAPLLPIAWSTRWRIVFRTWDRLIVPLPFSRGVFIYGEPTAYDGQDMDAVLAATEEALMRVTAAADEAMSHAPIDADGRPVDRRPAGRALASIAPGRSAFPQS